MTASCASCGHGEFYEVPTARVPNYEFSNSIEDLTLTAHYGPTGETGLFGAAKHDRVGIRMSARVCAKCGHIHWFVKDLAQLAEFADAGHAGVRRVTA